MLFQNNVGFQSLGDGALNVYLRASRFGATIVDQVNGRYYELASRSKIFSACNQSAGAVTALVAANSATTGFILNNPIGSNVQLALFDVCVAIATAPAGAGTFCLVGNAAMQAVIPTTLTAETVINNRLGDKSTGVGTVWNSAKLQTTTTLLRAIGGGPVATGSITPPFIRDEIAGQIVLLPGTAIALGSITTATSAITSMAWTETAL